MPEITCILGGVEAAAEQYITAAHPCEDLRRLGSGGEEEVCTWCGMVGLWAAVVMYCGGGGGVWWGWREGAGDV